MSKKYYNNRGGRRGGSYHYNNRGNGHRYYNGSNRKPTFLERNGDQLLVSGLTTLMGAVAPMAGEWLYDKFGPKDDGDNGTRCKKVVTKDRNGNVVSVEYVPIDD